jgi:hypothetical protein
MTAAYGATEAPKARGGRMSFQAGLSKSALNRIKGRAAIDK